MQLDITKDGETNLIALITAANPTVVGDETTIDIESIQPDTDPNNANNNTSAVISGLAGSNFTNSAKVFYHRLDISSIGTDVTTPVEVTSDKSSGDVFTLIEQHFGFVPGELGGSVSTPGSRPADTVVTGSVSESTVYTDGTRDFNVHWD